MNKVSKMQTTTTTVTHAVYAQPTQPVMKRRRLVTAWLQDVSGSMAGNREREAVSGLSLLHDDVLQDDDYLAVITFDHRVHVLHEPMRVSRVNKDKDAVNILKSGGGSTAIYDALKTCIQGLKEKLKDPKFGQCGKDAVFQLILLTDGGDNNCSTSLAEVAALVARPGIPNFHLVVVGISMGASTASTLRPVLCAPGHARFIDVADISNLGSTMRSVVTDVKARLVVQVETTTTRIAVVDNGGRGGGVCGNVGMLANGLGTLSLGGRGGRRGAAGRGAAGRGAGRGGNRICSYWQKGGCTFGENCNFKHA